MTKKVYVERFFIKDVISFYSGLYTFNEKSNEIISFALLYVVFYSVHVQEKKIFFLNH